MHAPLSRAKYTVGLRPWMTRSFEFGLGLGLDDPNLLCGCANWTKFWRREAGEVEKSLTRVVCRECQRMRGSPRLRGEGSASWSSERLHV